MTGLAEDFGSTRSLSETIGRDSAVEENVWSCNGSGVMWHGSFVSSELESHMSRPYCGIVRDVLPYTVFRLASAIPKLPATFSIYIVCMI